MASIPKELLIAFPIDYLFLIFSAGLLFTICIPFDFFALDFTHGLLVPRSVGSIPNLLTENFRPFILVKYLSDFPNGLIKIFLVSLVPGVVFFFLQDSFSKINNFIARQRISSKYVVKIPWDEDQLKRTRQQIEFSKWLRETGRHKSINFLWSLHCVAVGWFFALESMFVGYFILTIIIAVINQNVMYMLWSLFIFIMGVASYVIYLCSLISYNNKFAVLVTAFLSKEATFT